MDNNNLDLFLKNRKMGSGTKYVGIKKEDKKTIKYFLKQINYLNKNHDS